MRPGPTALVGLLGSLVLAGGGVGAPAQDDPLEPPPGFEEGALRNDTFLPTRREAAEALFEGDAQFVAARGGAAGTLPLALDAWRRALTVSDLGDSVPGRDPNASEEGPWSDPDGTLARRSEGVALAVRRRLAELTSEERATWRARFESIADEQLAEAGRDQRALSRVERDLPGTTAAVRAALICADMAAVEGRPCEARAQLARARASLALLDDASPRLGEAVARRAASLAPRPPEPDPLAAVTRLDLVRADRFEYLQRVGRPHYRDMRGYGVRPGLAALSDGSLVVQTPRTLAWWPAELLDKPAGGRVSREAFDEALDIRTPNPMTSRSTGDWRLLPATDGERVLVVVDRGEVGNRRRGIPEPARGNVLACYQRQDDEAPEPVWILSSSGLERRVDDRWVRDATVEEPLGPGAWEIQPGPCLADGRVHVVARRLADPTRPEAGAADEIWLTAIDVGSGRPVWSRLLTRAAELSDESMGRLGSYREAGTSVMPIALLDDRLVVGTNQGLVCVLDAGDGRPVYTFRYRRRTHGAPGWIGGRAPLPDGDGFLLAPFDSDFAYRLALEPTDSGLRRARPLPIRVDEDVIVTGGARVLLQGRDGRAGALRWREDAGGSGSAVYLDEDETFEGAPFATASRVLVATSERVYLYDRARELALLHAEPLPPEHYPAEDQSPLTGDRGGDVVVIDGRVLVVGSDTLWVLRTR